MNNKGFAVTTMVYSAIILMTLVMFSVLAIEKNKYIEQKDYISSTEKALNRYMRNCKQRGDC